MKKLVERIVAVCLALAIVITAFTPVEAQAATKTVTKKLTMYVSETVELDIDSSKVVSIKSSKPSVICADSYWEGNCFFKCNKAGSATVTIKTKTKTYKYKITAKKQTITTSITPLSKGRVLLTVTNNSSQNFDVVNSHVFLKGAGSVIIRSDGYSFYNVPANTTVYKVVEYSSNSKLNMKESWSRVSTLYDYVYTKFKDVSSKMETSVKEFATCDDCDVKADFNVKVTNPLEKKVTGTVYMRLLDEDGNVVAADTKDFTIAAGKSKSLSLDCSDFVHEANASGYTYEMSITSYVKN